MSGENEFSVFIGGLPYSTEAESLKEFLKTNVVEPVGVRIIYDRDGKSRGFGYADFDSKEESEKCIELSGQELDGRTLRCNPADAKPSTQGGRSGQGGRGGERAGRGTGGDRGVRGGAVRGEGRGGGNFDNETPTKCLMIKNLNFDTDNDGLERCFADAKEAHVVWDRHSGKSRGFGFVEFDDIETATNVREELNGTEIDGRAVNIVFAKPRENIGGGRGGFGGRGSSE